MNKNRILEIIKNREKSYVEKTEEAINLFLPNLKRGMEIAFFESKQIELYILDVSILPQNFRFLRVEGKLITNFIGDKIEVEGETIEIDIENLWDFARPFSIVLPASLLDEGEAEDVSKYLIQVRENNDKIPVSILKENHDDISTVKKEFKKVNKELDEAQLFALKYFKSPSVH